MKKNILMFISIFFIYAIVDTAYQFLIGIKISTAAHAKAGTDAILSEIPRYPIFILGFFILITTALMVLVVIPSIKDRSVGKAIYKAIILGLTAYGTLAFANTWTITNYPLLVTLEICIEGILFSPIATGLTTWLFLRKEKTTN